METINQAVQKDLDHEKADIKHRARRPSPEKNLTTNITI
jgi:hypothetical protein